MNTPTIPRTDLLEQLIKLERPVEDVLSQLRAYPWDSDPLVQLTVDAVVSVLRRYMLGEIEAQAVAAWADAIEGRDDIGLVSKHRQSLKEVIWELANPEANGPITRDRASTLYSQLSKLSS